MRSLEEQIASCKYQECNQLAVQLGIVVLKFIKLLLFRLFSAVYELLFIYGVPKAAVTETHWIVMVVLVLHHIQTVVTYFHLCFTSLKQQQLDKTNLSMDVSMT